MTLGALTLENLLDSDAYKQVIVKLINEAATGVIVTVVDLPDLPEDTTVLWPKVIADWAKANDHSLPGKRVVASRLVEDDLAVPSQRGTAILKDAHLALSAVLEGGKA